MLGHGLAGPRGEAGRVLGGGVGHVLEGDADGQVGQRVVGGGLVGDDVDGGVHREQLRDQFGRVAEDADGQRPALVAGLGGELERVVEGVGPHVQVPVLDAALDGARIAVDADGDASFMVTARGWAPPMPPSPAVRVMVPARVPPNFLAATAAKVS